MPVPITTPRINNNDDAVRLSHIFTPAGTAVRKGDPIAEIETDKATFTVEADEEGYILTFVEQIGAMIPVGSVLAWLGHSPDETIPLLPQTSGLGALLPREPTLKAALLLTKLGLSAGEVPASGERLTAQDVLDFAHSRNRLLAQAPPAGQEQTHLRLPPGTATSLDVSQRAMLKTVLWHGRSAVPGYVEIEYDPRGWDDYAKAFQREHNLLLSPLLPLMAHRLTELAREHPAINCTVVGDHWHQYDAVNLGFTLQSEVRLSLLCVRDAAALTTIEFVQRLSSLMRQGLKDKLAPADTTDITLSFSSMARWQVTRHMPVLPPYTSLIVAHSHATSGAVALGATYDHRVLTGGEVAVVLRSLSVPTKP